jgi:hypothetical protein
VLVAPCAGAVVPPLPGCAGAPLDGVSAPAGVVVEPVLVGGALAAPDCEPEGGPATDTVLVAEPHPPTSTPAHALSTITGTAGRPSLIVRMVFGAVGVLPRPRSERARFCREPRLRAQRGEGQISTAEHLTNY